MMQKLEDKANSLASAGKDTSTVTAAITKAKADIQTAKDAISAQSANDYTVAVNSETSVKTDVLTTRNKLLQDLTATNKAVKTAGDSVKSALQSLLTVVGPNPTISQ